MWKITRKFEATLGLNGVMMIVGCDAPAFASKTTQNECRENNEQKKKSCGIFTQSHATCDVYLYLCTGARSPSSQTFVRCKIFSKHLRLPAFSDDNKFGCVRAWMRSTTITELYTHRGGSRSRFGALYLSPSPLSRCYHLRIYAEPWHRRIIYPSSRALLMPNKRFSTHSPVYCVVLCKFEMVFSAANTPEKM